MIKDGAEKALPQRVKKAVTQTPNTTEEPSDEKSKDTDYKKVYPKKLTAYKKHRYSGDELTKHIIGTDIPKKRSRGTVKDIINVWRQFYKKQKWDKLARFNTKGKLGVPYALFKAKNIIPSKGGYRPDKLLYKLWMGTFTYPTDLYLGGILKVGTLAKDQYTRTHACGLRLERERELF